jgi:xylulokinase
MTGEFASDMSDAAGTMWMDVAKRDWSDEMLAACGLTRDNMPALFEGCDITGHLLASVASAWKFQRCWLLPAAGIMPPVRLASEWRMPGRQCCRWAISGVYFAVSEGFLSKPESAVHSFCHVTWSLALNVSHAQCRILPGLGGEAYGARDGSCAD